MLSSTVQGTVEDPVVSCTPSSSLPSTVSWTHSKPELHDASGIKLPEAPLPARVWHPPPLPRASTLPTGQHSRVTYAATQKTHDFTPRRRRRSDIQAQASGLSIAPYQQPLAPWQRPDPLELARVPLYDDIAARQVDVNAELSHGGLLSLQALQALQQAVQPENEASNHELDEHASTAHGDQDPEGLGASDSASLTLVHGFTAELRPSSYSASMRRANIPAGQHSFTNVLDAPGSHGMHAGMAHAATSPCALQPAPEDPLACLLDGHTTPRISHASSSGGLEGYEQQVTDTIEHQGPDGRTSNSTRPDTAAQACSTTHGKVCGDNCQGACLLCQRTEAAANLMHMIGLQQRPPMYNDDRPPTPHPRPAAFRRIRPSKHSYQLHSDTIPVDALFGPSGAAAAAASAVSDATLSDRHSASRSSKASKLSKSQLCPQDKLTLHGAESSNGAHKGRSCHGLRHINSNSSSINGAGWLSRLLCSCFGLGPSGRRGLLFSDIRHDTYDTSAYNSMEPGLHRGEPIKAIPSMRYRVSSGRVAAAAATAQLSASEQHQHQQAAAQHPGAVLVAADALQPLAPGSSSDVLGRSSWSGESQPVGQFPAPAALGSCPSRGGTPGGGERVPASCLLEDEEDLEPRPSCDRGSRASGTALAATGQQQRTSFNRTPSRPSATRMSLGGRLAATPVSPAR